MQLCGSLSGADKALECTQAFLPVRKPVHHPDPSPRAHSIKKGSGLGDTIIIGPEEVGHDS